MTFDETFLILRGQLAATLHQIAQNLQNSHLPTCQPGCLFEHPEFTTIAKAILDALDQDQ